MTTQKTMPNIGDVITYKNRHNAPANRLQFPADSDHVVTGVFMSGVTVKNSDKLIYHFYYDVKTAHHFVAPAPLSKQELLESLASIEQEDKLPLGVLYVGSIDNVYPDFETDAYRTDIWETREGVRIATWNIGNGHCQFMCEGTLEILKEYLEAQDKARRDEIAVPGSLVMFPVNPELAHIPRIHDFTFRAETVTEEGITIAGYDQVFAHHTYII